MGRSKHVLHELHELLHGLGVKLGAPIIRSELHRATTCLDDVLEVDLVLWLLMELISGVTPKSCPNSQVTMSKCVEKNVPAYTLLT